MRHNQLEHRLVERLPEALTPGILYVSMTYGTIAHLCCCGCGEEVVTPLGPTDWRMVFDGEAVSILPSVGNWTLPCRSHYVIDRGHVIEAAPWTDKQVAAELQRDRAAKALLYGQPAVAAPAPPVPPVKPAEPAKVGFWRSIWRAIVGA